MKIRMIQWDWRELPDMNQLERALSEVFDGNPVPLSRPKKEKKRYFGPDEYRPTHIRIVPDDVVMSDCHIAIVASERLDNEKAREIYRAYEELEEKIPEQDKDDFYKNHSPERVAVEYPFVH